MKHLKKLPIWAKILMGFITVIVVILIGGAIFVNAKLNKINRPEAVETVPPAEEFFETDVAQETTGSSDTANQETQAAGDAQSETTDYSSITWPSDDSIVEDKDVINILLIGQDKRPGQSRQRSDSMMIATINKKNNTLTVTSLMRDMYVQIPGYSDNRINAAYAFGGMELLDATIKKNFLIQIDGNIEVDFDGFQQIIDKIGGIDITINSDEATYLGTQGFPNLSAGTIHMSGSLALAYSRIRYIGNADYERTERQRRVLTTAFAKIKNLGVTDIMKLADEMLPLVTTDLSNGQIFSLTTSVISMGISNVETNRIPLNGTYTSANIRGMAVLVPDLTANRTALKEIIYGE